MPTHSKWHQSSHPSHAIAFPKHSSLHTPHGYLTLFFALALPLPLDGFRLLQPFASDDFVTTCSFSSKCGLEELDVLGPYSA